VLPKRGKLLQGRRARNFVRLVKEKAEAWANPGLKRTRADNVFKKFNMKTELKGKINVIRSISTICRRLEYP
jgi:hypothetical protein